MTKVDVWWSVVGADDEAWRWNRVLYTYLHPRTREVLYVGKAQTCTVWGRYDAPDKVETFRKIRDVGVPKSLVVVLVGEIISCTPTAPLLRDVESLLILELGPLANSRNTRTRSRFRSGTDVRCLGGAWPERRLFRDGAFARSAP
jgi:hypothetical protein